MTDADKEIIISKDEWEKKLREREISSLEMKKLVMEYLVIEGYKDAAESFSIEAGVTPSVDLGTIEDRMLIRNNVQNGDIQTATEQVNEINCELLETEPELFFKLKQQQLIELIRQGKIEDALTFAQEELAVKGEEFPELLPELEKTMALFAADLSAINNDQGQSQLPDEIQQLLDYKHRQQVASQLNSALLAAQNQPCESRLPSLLHLLAWAQQLLESKAKFPKITNIFSGELEYPEDSSPQKHSS